MLNPSIWRSTAGMACNLPRRLSKALPPAERTRRLASRWADSRERKRETRLESLREDDEDDDAAEAAEEVEEPDCLIASTMSAAGWACVLEVEET
jgi:hypothetical protein